MIGQSLAFAPNYNKAKISGARILALLDRRPKIENSPGVGLQIVSSSVASFLPRDIFLAWTIILYFNFKLPQRSSTGSVKFEQIAFHYPTRPSAKILKSLSMEVQPGTSIALVG